MRPEPYLYLDLGNTAGKAWLLRAGRVEATWRGTCGVALRRWLKAPAQAFVASVRDVQHAEQFIGDAGLDVQAWVHVDPVRFPTRYAHPERLGVDRWLSVLGASVAHERAVIVDAGTAITVDLLNEGHHAGGYILPGLQLQANSLLSATARVRFNDAVWSDIAPGQDTATCVAHGILRATVALIQAFAIENGCDVVLDGGNVSELLPWLPEAKQDALLLPRGMALALGHAWQEPSP